MRWAGVSNFDVALLERCEPIHHVDSLQPPFSAIDRAAAQDLLPWCASHGTGVIAYSPMMSGLLTGRFSHARAEALDDTDWRKRFPPFVEPELSRNLALADALEPIAARHDVSVAAVAVAWTLAWPGLTAAIVGARAPDQVDGWIAAAELRLDAADLDRDRERHRDDGGRRGPGATQRLRSRHRSPPTSCVGRVSCSTPSSPARPWASRCSTSRCGTSASTRP